MNKLRRKSKEKAIKAVFKNPKQNSLITGT